MSQYKSWESTRGKSNSDETSRHVLKGIYQTPYKPGMGILEE